jgi:predicted DNA-binding transcriptional regulator AlpA
MQTIPLQAESVHPPSQDASRLRLMTLAEVQRALGYRSRDSVYRVVRAGKLPEPIRLTSSTAHPRWRVADVEACLAALEPEREDAQ